MNDITYVGLDAHKAMVWVAVAENDRGWKVRQHEVFENYPAILNSMVARLGKTGRRLSFCYEADPCGHGLRRLLTGYGHSCVVVAPSLIPMKDGRGCCPCYALWRNISYRAHVTRQRRVNRGQASY